MTWETARRAIDLARAGGLPFILQFSGGEPLLVLPLLQQIVHYVRINHIPARMDLQTNGTLLTEETATFLRSARIGILTADLLCTMRFAVILTAEERQRMLSQGFASLRSAAWRSA